MTDKHSPDAAVERATKAAWPWFPTMENSARPMPHKIEWDGDPKTQATVIERAQCYDLIRMALSALQPGDRLPNDPDSPSQRIVIDWRLLEGLVAPNSKHERDLSRKEARAMIEASHA